MSRRIVWLGGIAVAIATAAALGFVWGEDRGHARGWHDRGRAR